MNPKSDYSLIILVTLKPMIDISIIKIEDEIIRIKEILNCINSKDPKSFSVIQ